MSNSKPLVVVYSPVGGGHRAAAEALVERAQARGHATVMLNAFDFAPKWFGDLYLRAHLTGQSAVPTFYGAAYEEANRRGGVLERARLQFDELTFKRLSKHVLALNPSAVVATHHLPLIALANERRHGRLTAPLTCVVTDYTAHAVWAEEGVSNFAVANLRAERELRGHGVLAPTRIAVTGIPVKQAFSLTAPLKPLAEGETLRVLVTTGGFGVGPLGRIIRSFRKVSNVHLTVIAGASVEAKRAAEHAMRGLNGEVIGFERNMAARMRDAHIVLGKAGGLTVTEALTAARPLVLVGTVPGNESANEEHSVLHGAGCASRASKAGETASSLRGHLAAMSQRARASVAQGAADNVLRLLTLPSSQLRSSQEVGPLRNASSW
jgi:processive 1,2-diacylglycerol beta-glucosyltransferase